MIFQYCKAIKIRVRNCGGKMSTNFYERVDFNFHDDFNDFNFQLFTALCVDPFLKNVQHESLVLRHISLQPNY